MSNLDDIEIVPYEPGFEDQIIDLLEIAFGHWPDRDLPRSKIEHWRWKYLDNPLKKHNIILAKNKERLLGCDHAYYLNVKVGDRTFLVSQETDSAVHPDFQGRGLYSRMAKLRDVIHERNFIDFTYWISENPIFIESARRKGRPTLPFALKNMLWVKDIWLHLTKTSTKRKIYNATGYYFLKVMMFLRYFVSGEVEKEIPFTLVQISRFDDRINVFWERVKPNYNFIVERTRSYLNYRYCDDRAGNYRVVVAENDNEILGYLVLMVNRLREYASGNILDMLCLPDMPEVVNALVKDAMEFLRSEEVNVVRSWALEGHPYMKILEKNGFLATISDPPALFFNLQRIGEEWENFQRSTVEKVHLQMGDTEWM